MARLLNSKDAPIAIVGAGVFGLSTAIHLAQRGYTRVTVFDKQPYDEILYSFDQGCDSASSDRNKIIRAAYGSETIYQNLAFEALKDWEAWNGEIRRGKDLPPGFTQNSTIYINTGVLHLADPDGPELSPFEQSSIDNITAAGHGSTQYVLSNPSDQVRAKRSGFAHALDAFDLLAPGHSPCGLLDTAGGLVHADLACRFALHKARHLGVYLLLGGAPGTFARFLSDASTGRTTGIQTSDGAAHAANLVIIACGGWTPALLPELDGLCETSAGSLAFLRIPRDSELWDRYSPEQFPVLLARDGGLYAFPRDGEGVVKVGYRGTKYTNPREQQDGAVRSVPVTRFTMPAMETVPERAMEELRRFVQRYLPELRENGIGIEGTRLCWYTDTFDNHYLVDAVPGRSGVMVATGGCGHAFKMLPVLGRLVVDRIEGRSGPELEKWRWRSLAEGQRPDNVLMEGLKGQRALQNVPLA